jgi:hypothetical protein
VQHRIDSFDFVFLSFDEPNAELLYSKAADIAPWIKRVHGIKGFDSAHLACADTSDTDFFITVDGDNEIYPEFLDLTMDIAAHQDDHAWTWAGRNHINGLVYGNGGLKLWSKKFVRQMKSHENADDPRKSVEFCWDARYHEVNGCYSTSHPNSTPQQAWRSGFREGVKMCLDRGSRVSVQEFNKKIWYGNINRLCIWSSVGQDVENGIWAMYGARMGTHLAMLTNDDHSIISDYDQMQQLWDQTKNDDPYDGCTRLGSEIKTKIGLDITIMRAEDSQFFKRVYMNPPRPWMPNEQIAHFMATRNV